MKLSLQVLPRRVPMVIHRCNHVQYMHIYSICINYELVYGTCLCSSCNLSWFTCFTIKMQYSFPNCPWNLKNYLKFGVLYFKTEFEDSSMDVGCLSIFAWKLRTRILPWTSCKFPNPIAVSLLQEDETCPIAKVFSSMVCERRHWRTDVKKSFEILLTLLRLAMLVSKQRDSP